MSWFEASHILERNIIEWFSVALFVQTTSIMYIRGSSIHIATCGFAFKALKGTY